MIAAAATSRPAAIKWILLVALGIAALWGIDSFVDRRAAPKAYVWQDSPFSARGIPRTYTEAATAADLAIASAKAASVAGADQWLMHEILAGKYLARAQLSGSYDDYAAADRALDAGFKLAPARSGPHMMRAKLDFAMHRLAATEAMLSAVEAYAVPPSGTELADMIATKGDIAFYRGQLLTALALYDRADALAPGTADFRRAVYAARTGNADSADAYFATALRDPRPMPPQSRSFIELQRGILDLDRGRLTDAMVHFRAADGIFPGHWLIEEHIAEVLTLQGETGKAEKIYQGIVRRTGNPEFMDALARIAEARGDTATAQRLFGQASQIWTRRLQQFPEAAYGHGFDHCVAMRDWPCALRLAKRNDAARPYGDAKIALARALLGSGRTAEARAVIELVLASAWRTAALHRTAADIYTAIGMLPEAAAQNRLARAINPRA